MNQKTFVVEIPVDDPEKMDKFQEAMDKVQDETNDYIRQLAIDLGVSEWCAMDVFYLRSRSRWTQELEDKLIRLYQEGNPPNMCEFE